MRPDDSLKAIERQAYTAIFQDGLYDLLWGTIFLVLAWIPAMEAIEVPRLYLYPAILVPALVFWLGKRHLTIPRMGMVEFGSKRKNLRRLIGFIGVCTFVLMFPLVVMLVADGIPDGRLWMYIALIAAPIFAIAVIFLDFSRMYIYAAWLFFAIYEAEFLKEYIAPPYNSVVAFGLPGIAITAFGLVLLVKFLADHPGSVSEITHVSR